MNKYVLDASSLLALLLKENGHDRVAQVLSAEETFVSSLNLAEVASKLVLSDFPFKKVQAALQALNLNVVDLSVMVALESAAIALATKPYGFSLGNCICLATAKYHQAVALTADRRWAEWDGGIKVEVIR